MANDGSPKGCAALTRIFQIGVASGTLATLTSGLYHQKERKTDIYSIYGDIFQEKTLCFGGSTTF